MDIASTFADGVMTIGFDRPTRKNAITAAMYERLSTLFAQAEVERAVRVVLLHGSDTIFTAGNDLEDFLRSPPIGQDAPVFQFLRAISTASKPVIAAVAGAAVGIGTTLLLHCDAVYAADTVRFSLPFVALGLCPEAGSSLLLPRLAGYQRAADKLLFGAAFDAEEAVALGLVTKIVPAAELREFALARARQLVASPAASLRATKALMKNDDRERVAARIAAEAEQFRVMLTAPEAREAFAAFFEKRKPDFSQFG